MITTRARLTTVSGARDASSASLRSVSTRPARTPTGLRHLSLTSTSASSMIPACQYILRHINHILAISSLTFGFCFANHKLFDDFRAAMIWCKFRTLSAISNVCILSFYLNSWCALSRQKCRFKVAVFLAAVVNICNSNSSVPARLGKGQGAKEIGHNLAREQPNIRHNLVRKRHKITFTRERPKFGLVSDWWKHGHKSASILQAFLHRLSENTKKKQLHFVKIKQFFFIRAGRVHIGQGASQYGQGAAPSEIGLAGTLNSASQTGWVGGG